jgi:hypothetical protein
MADPDHFIFKKPNDEFNEHNSVKFRLHVICKRKPEYQNYTHQQLIDMDPEVYLTNSTIYSSHLVWEPQSGQSAKFKNEPVKTLHDNIILAKLRENQVRLPSHPGNRAGSVLLKEHWQSACQVVACLHHLLQITAQHPIQGSYRGRGCPRTGCSLSSGCLHYQEEQEERRDRY